MAATKSVWPDALNNTTNTLGLTSTWKYSKWWVITLGNEHFIMTSVCLYSCSFRCQHVLDKYFNDRPQREEKAREELVHCHAGSGVDPATQLTSAGLPASLQEDIEVEHALDAFLCSDNPVGSWCQENKPKY